MRNKCVRKLKYPVSASVAFIPVVVTFVALTTVNDCNPAPAFTWLTATEPDPLDTPKETIPPGNRSPSVTVVNGVQICDFGVGVGVG